MHHFKNFFQTLPIALVASPVGAGIGGPEIGVCDVVGVRVTSRGEGAVVEWREVIAAIVPI